MYRTNESSKDLVPIHQVKKPLTCKLFGCKPSTKHPKLLYILSLVYEEFYSPLVLCMCERCGEDIILETKYWYSVPNTVDSDDKTVFLSSLPYQPYERSHCPYQYIDYLIFEALKLKPNFKRKYSFSRFLKNLFENQIYMKFVKKTVIPKL